MVISNTIRDSQECVNIGYYILSRKLTAKKFAAVVKGHWAIENRLHWQLDVTFREDHCRIRKGNADANFSILRRTALTLLKNEKTAKPGVKTNGCQPAGMKSTCSKSLSEREIWCDRPDPPPLLVQTVDRFGAGEQTVDIAVGGRSLDTSLVAELKAASVPAWLRVIDLHSKKKQVLS